MAGRMEGHVDVADPDLLAKRRDLAAGAKLRPIPKRHDVEGFRGGHDGVMARARMIAVPVRDQGARDRAHRINMKIAGGAIKAGRRQTE